MSKDWKKRFYPLICWFDPMDINSVKYIEFMFKNNPWVFCWIGEVFYRHDDLTLLTYWENSRMNTRSTYKIFEFASKYNLPICFHNNLTSTWVSDYPKYLYEMEDVLKKYPRVKSVFCHCWYSRRVIAPYYIDMLTRLLLTYENLYIDYSWIVFDEIICKNDITMEERAIFSEKFSNRIIIGSDLLWTSLYKVWIENSKYNNFLSLLSNEAREKVCISNVENVYWRNKNKTFKEIKLPKLSKL